jgi:hypothetical protein
MLCKEEKSSPSTRKHNLRCANEHQTTNLADASDSVSQAELDQALEIAPRGALALAGAALAYLLVYFLVFLPRGAVS